MKETKNNHWKRVAIEAVTIVGSILFAFAIDAWWDTTQERKEERGLLSVLLAEFEANQKVIAQTAYVHRLTLDAMKDIVSKSESESSTYDAAMQETFRLAAVTPHYNPATGALAAAISSGHIVLVRNVALRNRLAGWNAVISDLVLDEQTRRDFVVHELSPAFAEFGIGGAVSVTKGTETDFSAAMKSRQLLANLRSQIQQVTHLVTHFDEAGQATQDMISDLSEELESL